MDGERNEQKAQQPGGCRDQADVEVVPEDELFGHGRVEDSEALRRAQAASSETHS